MVLQSRYGTPHSMIPQPVLIYHRDACTPPTFSSMPDARAALYALVAPSAAGQSQDNGSI